MKNRKLNKIYATFMGYFWLPCPLCSQMFGGHEWKERNILMVTSNIGKGVCIDCSENVKWINQNHQLKCQNKQQSTKRKVNDMSYWKCNV